MPDKQETRTESAYANEQVQCCAEDIESELGGRYSKIEALAQGGMGKVYSAFDKKLQRKVAIKVLEAYKANEQDSAYGRFISELKTLAKLKHENIVQIHSWGHSKSKKPYYVMEFLEGGSLKEQIGSGKKLSVARFCTIFESVLQGLAHAHKESILHRDLKPANNMLSQGTAKIIDFGLARYFDNDKPAETCNLQTGTRQTSAGSPAYMSPEQCRGQKLDQRSDLYSLGCIMYESLSGYPPHQGDSAIELMYKHINEPVQNLSELCKEAEWKELCKLIDHCLEKQADKRPESADIVLAAIQKIIKRNSENGKLCLSQANATSSKSKPTAIAALVISSLFACSLFTIWQKQQVDLKKETESRAAGKKLLRRKLEMASAKGRLAVNLEQELIKARDDESRAYVAHKLFNAYKSRSLLLSGAGDYKESFEAAKQALGISGLIDLKVQDHRAWCLQQMAETSFGMKKRQEGEHYLNQAADCKLSDPNLMGFIANSQIVHMIQTKDFAGLETPLERLLQAGNMIAQSEVEFKQIGYVHMLSNVGKCIQNLPPRIAKTTGSREESEIDKISILKVQLRLAQYLLEHGDNSQTSVLRHHISQLSAYIPAAASYKELRLSTEKTLDQLCRTPPDRLQ